MKKIFLLLSVGFLFHSAMAQSYADEIAAFKLEDSVRFPAKKQILFIGSSSFRLLRDTTALFPGYPILNRAFGGATLVDVIHWRYETVFPYEPRQIVLYCGENDLAASDTVTAAIVADRLRYLFRLIRARYPSVPFVYVSMKPSPSRIHLVEKIAAANRMIQVFLQSQQSAHFADVFTPMLRQDGSPDPALFRADMLHMNPRGYAIWKKHLQPLLIK